jgi:hypothetical protein
MTINGVKLKEMNLIINFKKCPNYILFHLDNQCEDLHRLEISADLKHLNLTLALAFKASQI